MKRIACVAAFAMLVATACGACVSPSATGDSNGSRIPLTADGAVDVSGGAWRMIEVPAASNAPEIVRTPDGWLALSRRSQGDAKAPSAWQNVLYHSTDGVSWRSLPLDAHSDYLQLSGLAFGAGRYVMVGSDYGGEGVVWSSSDAEHWTQTKQGMSGPGTWGKVVFVRDRFLALGFRLIGVSTDGMKFTQVPNTTVQPTAAAYGNGRYLIVGSGPMQVSTDGLHFTAHDVDCALPGACITDPSGGVHQGIEYQVLFAEGRFFSDQLSSPDGVTWRAEPERLPAAYVSAHFLDDGGYDLHAWTLASALQALPVIRPVAASVTAEGRSLTSVGVLDRDSPLPKRVDVGFDDGLTCETASCVLLGSRLYLVPPPGTAPLPDRVPRTADGKPLLSDSCPFSTMIFCSDYKKRSGCKCDPEAPSRPEACHDVSQYACEGSFSARTEEWQVAEVAEGGCACNAVDPNQPESFGQPCEQDASVCLAPLSCLAVQAPPSYGPPQAQPMICTASCSVDADCPSWQATGFCAGPVALRCTDGVCQPRSCE